LEEAGYPVLQLREENLTFMIVEGGKVDFFLFLMGQIIYLGTVQQA